MIFDDNSSPMSLSVDSKYGIIYWINYILANNSYILMKTFFNGSTSQVKLYPAPTSSVKIAIGEDNFYVMDVARARIDRFDRETSSWQHSFQLSDTPSELTVVDGEA